MSRSRRSGLTLFEVVIATAIVGLLSLVLMAAQLPLGKTSTAVGTAFDMDRSATAFLGQLRREVRQSGYNTSAAEVKEFQLSLADGLDGGPSTLAFRHRTAWGNVVDDTPSSAWSRQIGYRLAPSALGSYPTGAARYRVVRSMAGGEHDVLDHVQALRFELIQGPDLENASLTVSVTLAREDSSWDGSGAPRVLVRTYGEVVEFLNKQ